MTMRAWLPALAAIGLVFTAACGSHNPKAQTPEGPTADPAAGSAGHPAAPRPSTRSAP